SCGKFEFMGILCCHVLKATNHTLTAIPAKYILKRWTREASSISSHQ
ncbi:SWIM zinc finger family protein, partial [Mycobacterium kansasii]